MNDVHVRIRVGAETYAVPVAHVVEVAELGKVTPVPGASATALGVRNLHGEVIPVFDLAAVLGIAGGGSPGALLVTELERRRVGFAVDEVVAVDAMPEPVEETESEFLAGAALVDEGLVGYVDVTRLFETLEPAQR